MKNHLIILLILTTLPVMSQIKLGGTYYSTKSFENYEYIKFQKDFSFEHKISYGDVGYPESNIGEYSISKNLLILNYNNSQAKKLSYHKIENWKNKKDSIEINFKIMDLKGNPIEYVWISEENRAIKIRTNENGFGEFKSKKSNEIFNYTVSWYGFEQYKLQVISNFNQKIEVYLTYDSQYIPIKKQIDTLKIKEFQPTFFITDQNIKWKKSEQEY